MSFKVNVIGAAFNSNIPVTEIEYNKVYSSVESPNILVCRDAEDGFLVFNGGYVFGFTNYRDMLDSFNLEFVTHSTSEIEITIKHKEG